MGEQEQIATKYCSNCKKDIPSVNYVMHSSHCSRNIILCQLCKEPVPISEKDEHFEENHAKVKCECGESFEKMDLESHKETDCTSRKVVCEYCELELPFLEMKSHKDFCGSRTQLCDKCHKYVQHKDLDDHLSSDCRAELPPRQNNNGAATMQHLQRNRIPPDEFVHNVDHGDIYDFEVDALQRFLLVSQAALSPGHYDQEDIDEHRVFYDIRNVFPQLTRDVVARGLNSNSNIYEEEIPRINQLERDELIASILACQDDGTGFDYPSVNSERDPFPRCNSFDDDNAEFGNHNQDSALDQTVLPCEFCGEAIQAQDLILHQTGCQLTSIEAANLPSSGRYPNLRSQPRSLPPIQYESFNDEIEQDNQTDDHDETLLPCEFCDELIHPNFLFTHQSMCDPQRTRPSSVLQTEHFYERDSEPSISNNARPRDSSRPPRPSRPVVNRRLEDITKDMNQGHISGPSASALSSRNDTGQSIPGKYRGEIRRQSPLRRNDAHLSDSPPTINKRDSATKIFSKKEEHRRSFLEMPNDGTKDKYEVSSPSKGSSGSREKLSGSTGLDRSKRFSNYQDIQPAKMATSKTSVFWNGSKAESERDSKVFKALQEDDHTSNYPNRESSGTRSDKNKTTSAKTSSSKKKIISSSVKKSELAPSFDVKPLLSGESRRQDRQLSQSKSEKNGSSDRRGIAASNENRDTNTDSRIRKSKKKFA